MKTVKKYAYEITDEEIDNERVYNYDGKKVTGLNKDTWWYIIGKDWFLRSYSGHKYTEFDVDIRVK